MKKRKVSVSEMTTQEKIKHYKKKARLNTVAKYSAISLPYIILTICKWDEYFVDTNTSVKTSIGFLLCILVWVSGLKNEINKDNKKVSSIITWAILFILSWLLSAMLDDLTLILGLGLVGQVGACGFDIGIDKNKTIYLSYEEELRKKEVEIEK